METVETWRDILGPQAIDLALLVGFIALALVGFFRKSVRLKYITLAAAVGYMGFVKSRLVSVVDLFAVADWNLPVFKYNLAWYLLSFFVLASTVLWGRLYCGRICAFGALTQLMDLACRGSCESRSRPDSNSARMRSSTGCWWRCSLYFVATRDVAVYRYVEPFWMFGLFGTTPMWIGLVVLLLATVFVRNLYCRFLCPVGALLGVISKLTVFKIKRWSECNTCKICEKTCEWGAIRGPKIIEAECVRCDDCERLYLDQQKCPHWIILRRKGDKLFVSS